MLLVVLICFDDHGSCIGWCGMPRPMQHAQGFPRCHRRMQFIVKPYHISVLPLCHYPNDEDLNIWEESGANKLAFGEHQVSFQGHSAVSITNLRRNSTLRNNNPQSWCYWSYWSVLMTMAAVSGDAACLAQGSMLRASPDATGCCCQVSVCKVLPG